jgi:hypothetical protein
MFADGLMICALISSCVYLSVYLAILHMPLSDYVRISVSKSCLVLCRVRL